MNLSHILSGDAGDGLSFHKSLGFGLPQTESTIHGQGGHVLVEPSHSSNPRAGMMFLNVMFQTSF